MAGNKRRSRGGGRKRSDDDGGHRAIAKATIAEKRLRRVGGGIVTDDGVSKRIRRMRSMDRVYDPAFFSSGYTPVVDTSDADPERDDRMEALTIPLEVGLARLIKAYEREDQLRRSIRAELQKSVRWFIVYDAFLGVGNEVVDVFIKIRGILFKVDEGFFEDGVYNGDLLTPMAGSSNFGYVYQDVDTMHELIDFTGETLMYAYDSRFLPSWSPATPAATKSIQTSYFVTFFHAGDYPVGMWNGWCWTEEGIINYFRRFDIDEINARQRIHIEELEAVVDESPNADLYLDYSTTADFRVVEGFKAVQHNNMFVNIPVLTDVDFAATNRLWEHRPIYRSRVLILKCHSSRISEYFALTGIKNFPSGVVYIIKFQTAGYTQYSKTKALDAFEKKDIDITLSGWDLFSYVPAGEWTALIATYIVNKIKNPGTGWWDELNEDTARFLLGLLMIFAELPEGAEPPQIGIGYRKDPENYLNDPVFAEKAFMYEEDRWFLNEINTYGNKIYNTNVIVVVWTGPPDAAAIKEWWYAGASIHVDRDNFSWKLNAEKVNACDLITALRAIYNAMLKYKDSFESTAYFDADISQGPRGPGLA